MDPQRWQEAQRIFHAALERPPGERTAYVRDTCAGDTDLAADVLALLAEDAFSDSLLDRGVAETAGAVLDWERAFPKQIGPYSLKHKLG